MYEKRGMGNKNGKYRQLVTLRTKYNCVLFNHILSTLFNNIVKSIILYDFM